MVMDFLGRDEPVGIYNEHDLGWFNDNFDYESVVDFLHEAYGRVS